MSFFEAAMLICFGISWPISIAKSVRTKVVSGKSPLFMAILCLGYASGLIHKCLYSLDWITALYALNLCMVALDLTLYFKFLPKERQTAAAATNGTRASYSSRVRAWFVAMGSVASTALAVGAIYVFRSQSVRDEARNEAVALAPTARVTMANLGVIRE